MFDFSISLILNLVCFHEKLVIYLTQIKNINILRQIKFVHKILKQTSCCLFLSPLLMLFPFRVCLTSYNTKAIYFCLNDPNTTKKQEKSFILVFLLSLIGFLKPKLKKLFSKINRLLNYLCYKNLKFKKIFKVFILSIY